CRPTSLRCIPAPHWRCSRTWRMCRLCPRRICSCNRCWISIGSRALFEQDRAGRRAVGESFGRAARSYDAHATLQLAAARTLLGMLPEMAPALALDIGVGTGPVTRALCERLPATRWLALDIAEPMLREDRKS